MPASPVPTRPHALGKRARHTAVSCRPLTGARAQPGRWVRPRRQPGSLTTEARVTAGGRGPGTRVKDQKQEAAGPSPDTRTPFWRPHPARTSWRTRTPRSGLRRRSRTGTPRAHLPGRPTPGGEGGGPQFTGGDGGGSPHTQAGSAPGPERQLLVTKARRQRSLAAARPQPDCVEAQGGPGPVRGISGHACGRGTEARVFVFLTS